jgi:hypothetical protein
MRQVKIVRKMLVWLLITLSALNTSCSKNKHFSTYEPGSFEIINKLCGEISSKEDAIKYFNEWLTTETNFTDKDNGIDCIEKYRDYYEIRLKTSIIINGRKEGYMGYRDYVITKDGYLKGYYYSK